MMNFLSIVCLSAIFALCLAGVFSRMFADNWLQFIGLWSVVIWSASRIVDVLSGGQVTAMQLFAHAGVAVYALGTAIKVRRYGSMRNSPWQRRPQ